MTKYLNTKRLADFYKRLAEAEEGIKHGLKYNSRLDYIDSTDGILDDCHAFIYANKKAVENRTNSIRALMEI